MSHLQNFFWRLTRVLDTLQPVQLDERSIVGDRAEIYAEQIIKQFVNREGGVYLRSPLIPASRGNWEAESDFLVYTKGKLFCVEIKSLKGTISYRPGANGYDKSKIVYEKRGNYGEYIPPKYYDNPLRKTQLFINDLRKYIVYIDRRFQRFPIIPVVGFTWQSDIVSIHDWKTGMIYIDELPQFFEYYKDHKFAQQPSRWVIDTILNKIPTWDWVVTTRGELMGGELANDHLTFQGADGKLRNLPYSTIRYICWHRGAFSSYDQMIVYYTDGTSEPFQCVRGVVYLDRGQSHHTHKLRNLKKLIVGRANKYTRLK